MSVENKSLLKCCRITEKVACSCVLLSWK